MRKIFAITSLVLLLILPGCSLFSPSLDETGVVELEISQRETPPRISFVSAYRSSEITVIRGQIKYPAWTWFGTFFGHVDVTIEPPGDTKFTVHDVAINRKRIPKKRGHEAFFVARIATDPPVGTVITVEYTDEKHEIRK